MSVKPKEPLLNILKMYAKIGKNKEEFLILSKRKELTKDVGLYDIKSLIPKYSKKDL